MSDPRGTRVTTTERGLGWSHQKRRAQLLRDLVDGTPCDWCGKPMHHDQQLDADHTTPRSQGGTQADRLLHATCNRSRQDETYGNAHATIRDW